MDQPARRNVDQIASGDRIEQLFLLTQPQLRSTSRGDYYIAAFLQDRTRKVNSRMWQATEAIYNSLPQEGFVWVKGRAELYQNELQIVIDAIQPVPVEQVDLEDFLPRSPRDVEEMFGRMVYIIKQIDDKPLAALLKLFLDDQDLMRLFKTAPAAVSLHHAYLGGLLEHTLAVMELGALLVPRYPQLNADLVMAGLFLHDIGKTTELGYDISFKYTDQGKLLGHLVKGSLLLEQKINSYNQQNAEKFSPVMANCLHHIILSHHGIREFGCPILPAIPEAFAVHHLDNLDSKIALTLGEIEKDLNHSNWTNFVKSVDSALFKAVPGRNPA
jgi:3'-5' exoribonuclease